MRLRQKTVYLVGGTLILLLLLISLIVTRQSLHGLEKLEQQSLTRDIERVVNTLQYEFEKQAEFLRTWAYWDDTKMFVQGQLPDYIDTFALDETFPVYNKHAIIFANAAGQIIYAKEFNEAGAAPLSEDLQKIIQPYLGRSSGDLSEITGILRVPLGLAFFTSLPILNNEGYGPAAGTMISLTLLNETYLEDLRRQTRLTVDLFLPDASDLPTTVSEANALLEQKNSPALVTPVDAQTLAAYAFIADVNTKPVGIARVEEQRTIYQQGLQQLRLMITSLFVIGIVFIAFILALLELTVLSRLSRLSRHLREITQSGESASRVEVSGKDELAMLATDLNGLLQVIEERTQALERSNQELSRSNQELERFAYVASHDLQEPLRKVQTFSDRITSKYGAKLDEDGKVYLSRMQESLGRMRSLIQDLLAYSRVQSGKKEWVTVDLNEVVRGVISDLEVHLEQSGGRVIAQGLPTLQADPLRMRQVFQNLIGNSLKFSRPDLPPVVTISAQRKGENYEIVVKDNGIGFEQQYAERIFEVFQRLQARGSYEGTGIGLAIVKKILEHHGGSIRAESEVGQGARFFLSLPAHQTSLSLQEAREVVA
jgi:signal transduction histidine kinase